MTPVDRKLLASSLTSDGQMSLPAGAYADVSVFRWELEHFFDESWVSVGRAEDLRDAGDRRAVRLGRESVLLVRGEGGSLHAFYNVCRHRGHELLEVGRAASGRFVRCPYHAWCYGPDGELKGAPGFGNVTGFDKADYSLVPVRLAEWQGWLFANASGDAPPFEEHVGNLGEMIGNHRSGELVAGARRDYEVAANWKILVENYHECYHCPSIHPELCKVSPPKSGEDHEARGAWVGGSMELEDHAQTMSLTGESFAPTLPHLTALQQREVYYYQLFPNLLISLHPDYVLTSGAPPRAATVKVRSRPRSRRSASSSRWSPEGTWRAISRRRRGAHPNRSSRSGGRQAGSVLKRRRSLGGAWTRPPRLGRACGSEQQPTPTSTETRSAKGSVPLQAAFRTAGRWALPGRRPQRIRAGRR
jgi:Rieske 2Fe-2S family protein